MYMSRGSSFICWEELGIVIPHFKEELPVKRQVYVFTELIKSFHCCPLKVVDVV